MGHCHRFPHPVMKEKSTNGQKWSIVYTLIIQKMTSKYSKLCSETAHLQLMVPLEF